MYSSIGHFVCINSNDVGIPSSGSVASTEDDVLEIRPVRRHTGMSSQPNSRRQSMGNDQTQNLRPVAVRRSTIDMRSQAGSRLHPASGTTQNTQFQKPRPLNPSILNPSNNNLVASGSNVKPTRSPGSSSASSSSVSISAAGSTAPTSAAATPDPADGSVYRPPPGKKIVEALSAEPEIKVVIKTTPPATMPPTPTEPTFSEPLNQTSTEPRKISKVSRFIEVEPTKLPQETHVGSKSDKQAVPMTVEAIELIDQMEKIDEPKTAATSRTPKKLVRNPDARNQTKGRWSWLGKSSPAVVA